MPIYDFFLLTLFVGLAIIISVVVENRKSDDE